MPFAFLLRTAGALPKDPNTGYNPKGAPQVRASLDLSLWEFLEIFFVPGFLMAPALSQKVPEEDHGLALFGYWAS